MKAHTIAVLLLVSTSSAYAQAPENKKAPEPQQEEVRPNKKPPPNEVLGPPSRAVTEQVLADIKGQMDRAMKNLEIEGAPKPYSIAYKITEVDVNDVSATLGRATSRRNRHFVNLEVRVRVGSPQLDNGNFVVPDG